MSADFHLDIATTLTRSDLLALLTEAKGLRQVSDRYYGLGPLVNVWVEEEEDAHPYTEESFGFTATLSVYFHPFYITHGTNPTYRKMYEAIYFLLATLKGDAVLVQEGGATVLTRLHGELVIDTEWALGGSAEDGIIPPPEFTYRLEALPDA